MSKTTDVCVPCAPGLYPRGPPKLCVKPPLPKKTSGAKIRRPLLRKIPPCLSPQKEKGKPFPHKGELLLQKFCPPRGNPAPFTPLKGETQSSPNLPTQLGCPCKMGSPSRKLGPTWFFGNPGSQPCPKPRSHHPILIELKTQFPTPLVFDPPSQSSQI